VHVTYQVANVGNVRLRAARAVRVSGSFGPDRIARAEDLPELLPGNSFTFTQEVDGVFPAFRTDVEVRLAPYDSAGRDLDPAPEVAVARTRLTLWPTAQLCAASAVVAVLVLAWWLRRRSRRRTRRAVESAVADALAERARDAELAGRP
jgi:hypothetical protein